MSQEISNIYNTAMTENTINTTKRRGCLARLKAALCRCWHKTKKRRRGCLARLKALFCCCGCEVPLESAELVTVYEPRQDVEEAECVLPMDDDDDHDDEGEEEVACVLPLSGEEEEEAATVQPLEDDDDDGNEAASVLAGSEEADSGTAQPSGEPGQHLSGEDDAGAGPESVSVLGSAAHSSPEQVVATVSEDSTKKRKKRRRRRKKKTEEEEGREEEEDGWQLVSKKNKNKTKPSAAPPREDSCRPAPPLYKDKVVVAVAVPPERRRHVVGPRGEALRQVRQDYPDVRVSVPPPQDTKSRQVLVTGPKAQAIAAAWDITHRLEAVAARQVRAGLRAAPQQPRLAGKLGGRK